MAALSLPDPLLNLDLAALRMPGEAEAVDCYPRDYRQSRDVFRTLVAQQGGQLTGHVLPGRGSAGERLTIDVARIGSPSARRLAIISSGLHGVEGLVGSAIQQAWLRYAAMPADDSFAVLLIHAINPFGFAWGRRVDAENIDLNRNFLPPGQVYEGVSPGYRAHEKFLNPPHPPGCCDAYRLAAAGRIVWHGSQALKEAIAVGQYAFPRGLFFGGQGAAASTRVVCQQIAGWVGPATRVVHLDVHSGLGRWGRCRLLLATDEIGLRRRCGRYFEARHLDGLRGRKRIGYPARGTMISWLAAALRDRDYHGLIAEFGTHSAIRVLGALRAENRVYHWSSGIPKVLQRVRDELRECFCPRSRRWRVTVIRQGLEMIARALAACRTERRGG